MARGLCFQSLCAVIAILMVAPVRSVSPVLMQDWLPSTIMDPDVPSNTECPDLHVAVAKALRNMMDSLTLQYNETRKDFLERLDYMKQTDVPALKRKSPNLSSFVDTFGSTWRFSEMMLKVKDRVHSLEGYSSFIELRDKQQVVAYYTAYDLTRQPNMRRVMNDMPDSKTLFQTVYPIHLSESNYAGRILMQVGSTVGTFCNRLALNVRNMIHVVCTQLGYTDLHYAYKFASTGTPPSSLGPVLTGSVDCGGDETHLLLCDSEPLFDVHGCSHYNDIAVSCRR